MAVAFYIPNADDLLLWQKHIETSVVHHHTPQPSLVIGPQLIQALFKALFHYSSSLVGGK